MQYNNKEIFNFSTEFNNFEIYKNNRFEYINVSGKLCFAVNFMDFENNCRLKYVGYNNKWVKVLS